MFQVLYAAKYLKVAKETADKEVNILASLKSCSQVCFPTLLNPSFLFYLIFFYRLLLLLRFSMQSFTPSWSQSIYQVCKYSTAPIQQIPNLHFPGGDLFERLSPPDYHLTEDKCQLFVRQILQGKKYKCIFLKISFIVKFSGVDYLHSKNIIHLDIKPFNIVFSNKVIKKTIVNQSLTQ